MAGSASGQDEANPVFLSSQAGKMGLSCPLGLPALVPQKRNSVGIMFWPYNKSFIDQACSVKMPDIGLVLFCSFYGPRFRLGP